MGFFSAMQTLAKGKTEAEINDAITSMHERVGGRLGAYLMARKLLGNPLEGGEVKRRRSFSLHTIFRRNRKPGAPTPGDRGGFGRKQ